VTPNDELVSVVFTKWGDRPHWHFECPRLGEDAFGVWLVGPPGTRLQRADEPPIAHRHGFVQLIPYTGEWIASFDFDDWCEVYVDVTTAPVWDGGIVTCVDLDLDVIRRRDGRIELLDEDEFLEHQVRYGYPAAVIERARATADWLLEAVAARREPFGSTGAAWLATQPWASPQPR
jgi:hypothetical protein